MNLTFSIGVFKDQTGAKKRITELSKFYPECSIISQADGVFDYDYKKFCLDNNVVYSEQESLKKISASKWTERRFRFFLDNSNAEYVIKIDPDTQINNRIEFKLSDAFAPLCPETASSVAFSGCCFGLSRNLISRILECNILADSKYRPKRYPLEDMVLTDVFNRMGVKVEGIPEVLHNKRYNQEDVSKYAFIHPIKEWK